MCEDMGGCICVRTREDVQCRAKLRGLPFFLRITVIALLFKDIICIFILYIDLSL